MLRPDPMPGASMAVSTGRGQIAEGLPCVTVPLPRGGTNPGASCVIQLPRGSGEATSAGATALLSAAPGLPESSLSSSREPGASSVSASPGPWAASPSPSRRLAALGPCQSGGDSGPWPTPGPLCLGRLRPGLGLRGSGLWAGPTPVTSEGCHIGWTRACCCAVPLSSACSRGLSKFRQH